MRDRKRIEPILIEFKRVWEKNPDLRFFQLVDLLRTKLGKDAFYLEDVYLIDLLKKL